MNETGNRIWRPSVEPTQNALPFPSPQNQRKLYTKTSLVANKSDQSASLNRAILSASQSFNNSPRPFRRQDQHTGASVIDLPQVSFSSQSSYTRQQQQQQQKADARQEVNPPSTHKQATELSAEAASFRRAQSMSPKLVHKQYNSPLDLYSMSNIRKTIEAHTELIAPGVKGINFMKSDTPINKHSDVYRLVKEEEEQRAHHATSRLSPISGQPMKLPSGLQSGETSGGHQDQSGSCKQQQSASKTTECSWTNRQPATFNRSACPICCECGHSIVGPFAKIQNRFVHPQCFNCTTCGTSLKNTGYFTIENKLYCEIHAKQVASIMRIPFNFEASQRQGSASTIAQEATNSDQSAAAAHHCQSELRSHQTLGPQQPDTVTRLPTTFGGPATISTMFANRGRSQERVERRDQNYTRSASVNEVAASSSSQQAEASQLSSVSSHQFAGQQTMVSSNTTQDRRFIRESCQVGAGGRLPICVNCNAQIHGPYILASQTTWCKHCSQNHFNCSSCSRSLLDIGFIEDGSHRYYCEHCYEVHCAPVCSKCNIKIKGDCLNALNTKWHPSCFTCGHCRRPFGNSSFYLEDNVPYCERDWTILFTTKCYACSYPIEAGDKCIEALGRNYHSNCFKCTSCQSNLEGSTFYRKGDKPYCRLHAR